jgi:hypothetical protein
MKNSCLIILFVSIFCSCKKTDTLQSSTITCDSTISYAVKVKPLFISNCTASGCHDGVNSASLALYTTARDAAQQIRSAVSRGLMPMYSTLSAVDKAAIICWIDSGTKNN